MDKPTKKHVNKVKFGSKLTYFSAGLGFGFLLYGWRLSKQIEESNQAIERKLEEIKKQQKN